MEAYYQLLKEKFPKKSDILTEIINLEAICHLPKATEHFMSDLHGEYGAFDYFLRTASGTLKVKVEECFYQLPVGQEELDELCLFLYYPEEKMELERKNLTKKDFYAKILSIIPKQVQVVQYLGQKYTRSKVRKTFPKNFSYIIEELLAEIGHNTNKKDYFESILRKISELGQLEELVTALSITIQRLAVDVLHVVGDIYDRGKYPDWIMDRLGNLQNVDIQWGNHDITWMGAVSGSAVCMVNVIRIAARYNNLELIEDRYGINLRKLVDYSRKYYQPLPAFSPILDGEEVDASEMDTLNCVQQATAILQFKLESQLIERRPEFSLQHRDLLSKVNFSKQTITLDGTEYSLHHFNTSQVETEKPNQLSKEEEILLQQLLQAFQHSANLARHVAYLFENGSMYLAYNGNLLFHGCIPLHHNGDFKSLKINQESYSGKSLLDFYESEIRKSYRHPEISTDFSTDIFWYLWVGEMSSLFGKKAMTTFERYYIEDKKCHKELKNAYYHLRDEKVICQDILREFGLKSDGHIINGHTPIKEKLGETPIKAGGKMLVIDGGFAKPYQKKTGVAGYTLVSNSYGLLLIAHHPFTNKEKVIRGDYQVSSVERLVENFSERLLVRETNIGQALIQEIQHLEHLYSHFDRY